MDAQTFAGWTVRGNVNGPASWLACKRLSLMTPRLRRAAKGRSAVNESMTKAAVALLAAAAPDPRAVRLEWERDPFQTLLLSAGKLWDVLLIPGRIGYPACDVLARRVDAPGPVPADPGGTRTGFFVPPGRGLLGRHSAARSGTGVDRRSLPGSGSWRNTMAGAARRQRHPQRPDPARLRPARGRGHAGREGQGALNLALFGRSRIAGSSRRTWLPAARASWGP